MFKIFVAFVAGCIVTVAAVFLLDRPVSPPPLETSQSLQQSYDQLVESLASEIPDAKDSEKFKSYWLRN